MPLPALDNPIWTVGIVSSLIYACTLRKWYSLYSTVFCYVCYLARQQDSSVDHVPKDIPCPFPLESIADLQGFPV